MSTELALTFGRMFDFVIGLWTQWLTFKVHNQVSESFQQFALSLSPQYFHPSPAVWLMSALTLFGLHLLADLFTQVAEDSSLQSWVFSAIPWIFWVHQRICQAEEERERTLLLGVVEVWRRKRRNGNMSGLRPCFSVQPGCHWLWSCWSGCCAAARGGEWNGWWDLSAVCAGGEPSASPSTKPRNWKRWCRNSKKHRANANTDSRYRLISSTSSA